MKTAMQELEEKLKDNLKWIVMNADYELMDKLFIEGFEKEKEQIIKAYEPKQRSGFRSNGEFFSEWLSGEKYYNETYNQNK